MGLTIQYKANSSDEDIASFVETANSSRLKLSWGSEAYFWEKTGATSANGFTKIQSSWRPKTDFKRIINELKRIAEDWPGVRVDVVDDYVLLDWHHVKNIDLNNLDI